MPDFFPATRHDAGCGSLFPLAPGVTGSAIFSDPDDCYRYRLERRTFHGLGTVMFLMMNPSGADPHFNDRTIAKCWRLTQRWEYRRMLIGNVHAYRCTDQARLAEVADPIGPVNPDHLLAMADESSLIVVGYGTPKITALRTRGPSIARMLRANGHRLHVLRLSKDGVPVHPLYLPETLEPVAWEPPDA